MLLRAELVNGLSNR